MLLLRESFVRDVFDLSALNILVTPSAPILLSVLCVSENEMDDSLLLLRKSEVRDVFDLSALDNFIAPAVPILLPALSENEMKQQVCYR
jgi:hypothetical protein